MKKDVIDEEIVIIPDRTIVDKEIEFERTIALRHKNIVPCSMVSNYPISINYKLGYFKISRDSELNHSVGLRKQGELDAIRVVCSYTYEDEDELEDDKIVFMNVLEPEKVADVAPSRGSFKK